MAYMVPSADEHHWGYRGPPPFPLQPPHHPQPHIPPPRNMGLVSILTPQTRSHIPFTFPTTANGTTNTTSPMMFVPNDILVPGIKPLRSLLSLLSSLLLFSLPSFPIPHLFNPYARIVCALLRSSALAQIGSL